jgi:crotonobetainyl-CoA:carnitine CoA-transferase CaiB-like acyl-CoA transferase
LPGDPHFVTNPQRNAHRVALEALLEATLMQFDGEPLADPHSSTAAGVGDR